MKQYLSILVSFALFFACTPEENKIPGSNTPGGNNTNTVPSITGEAYQISAVSAILAGKANLGSSSAADLQVGFQYSKSAGILPSNSTTVEATDADANYNYTTPITGLEPGTKYYFRSFIRQDGLDTYGETKEFTTDEASSLVETLDASNVEAAIATLNAKLDLTDVLYEDLTYGFYWGVTDFSDTVDFKCQEILNNSISASLTGLSHNTQYWYKAYVIIDDQTLLGNIKAFTTGVIHVENVILNKTEHTFSMIGNTLALQATVLPAEATDKTLEWSSDNDSVATVNQYGVVTAINYGSTTITVKAKDLGVKATCKIIVSSGPKGDYEFAPDGAEALNCGHLWSKDTDDWMLYLDNSADPNEWITIEFVTKASSNIAELPTGNFNVPADIFSTDNIVPGTLCPYYDDRQAGPAGTYYVYGQWVWYSASAGNLKISKSGDNYTIELSFTDAEYDNAKVTSKYVGTVDVSTDYYNDGSTTQQLSPKKAIQRSMKSAAKTDPRQTGK